MPDLRRRRRRTFHRAPVAERAEEEAEEDAAVPKVADGFGGGQDLREPEVHRPGAARSRVQGDAEEDSDRR